MRLLGPLGEVGWVAEVLVNRTTGNVVDGHLRIELALARDEPTVPVTYVELSDADLLVADLVEPARATTLEQFDEGWRGLEIATAWLRSKASRTVDERDPAAPEPAPL